MTDVRVAEIPFILGSYTDLKPPRPIHPNEHAAAKMFQDAVGAFVRDPQAGLKSKMGWPMYQPNGKPLRESRLPSGFTCPHC